MGGGGAPSLPLDPPLLRTEYVRYSNRMVEKTAEIEPYRMAAAITGFIELLLEMPPKRVFREPKNAKEEKDYLDSCIPKATQYATERV